MLAALAFAWVAGCGSSRSVEPTPTPRDIRIAAPDSRLVRPCAYASGGWADADTQAKQEALILADRLALKACRERHAALVEYVVGIRKAVEDL